MSEKIILSGPDQNMTREEYQRIFNDRCPEWQKMSFEERTKKREELAAAIRMLTIDYQAGVFIDLAVKEGMTKEEKAAQAEYDKKYKPKAKEIEEEKTRTQLVYEDAVMKMVKMDIVSCVAHETETDTKEKMNCKECMEAAKTYIHERKKAHLAKKEGNANA